MRRPRRACADRAWIGHARIRDGLFIDSRHSIVCFAFPVHGADRRSINAFIQDNAGIDLIAVMFTPIGDGYAQQCRKAHDQWHAGARVGPAGRSVVRREHGVLPASYRSPACAAPGLSACHSDPVLRLPRESRLRRRQSTRCLRASPRRASSPRSRVVATDSPTAIFVSLTPQALASITTNLAEAVEPS